MSVSPVVSNLSPAGRTFTMSELVARTGTAPSTVRYYISTGLVPPGRRVTSNRFLYDERHVETLRLVQLLKERRKLSLEAIRRILPELLQLPSGGAFRPEMWDVVVEARERVTARTSPATRLLEAGIVSFDKHGYADVRVDDVCQAASVAKGSFYRHFASKEDLFFAAARAVVEGASNGLEEATLAAPLSFEAAVSVMSDSLEPHLPLLLDLISLAAQRRPGHGRVLREILAELERALRSSLDPMMAPERAEEVLERSLIAGMRSVLVRPLLDAGLTTDASGYSSG